MNHDWVRSSSQAIRHCLRRRASSNRSSTFWNTGFTTFKPLEAEARNSELETTPYCNNGPKCHRNTIAHCKSSSFLRPRSILCLPMLLATLPHVILRRGRSEAVSRKPSTSTQPLLTDCAILLLKRTRSSRQEQMQAVIRSVSKFTNQAALPPTCILAGYRGVSQLPSTRPSLLLP